MMMIITKTIKWCNTIFLFTYSWLTSPPSIYFTPPHWPNTSSPLHTLPASPFHTLPASPLESFTSSYQQLFLPAVPHLHICEDNLPSLFIMTTTHTHTYTHTHTHTHTLSLSLFLSLSLIYSLSMYIHTPLRGSLDTTHYQRVFIFSPSSLPKLAHPRGGYRVYAMLRATPPAGQVIRPLCQRYG